MLHTILTFLSFEGNKRSQLIFIHFHVVGSFIENWNSCIIYSQIYFLSVWWFKKAEQYFSIVGGDFLLVYCIATLLELGIKREMTVLSTGNKIFSEAFPKMKKL